MSRKFQIKVIPSEWIVNDGFRLDCRPYLSGAIEAKLLLQKLTTQPLYQMLKNGTEGVIISPYFKRVYVADSQFSIPLLGNTDILMADCSLCADNLALSVFNKYHGALELTEGSTLITCFGTVGHLSYCREDMAKCAASTNYMRLLPNINIIASGFLFAFLSGKYGIPLITQNETGSVVPNLLPSQIYNLPVPRLGTMEQQAHDLVQRAANLRVEATRLLKESGSAVNTALSFPEKMALSYRSFSCTYAYASQLVKRMEATYYDEVAKDYAS